MVKEVVVFLAAATPIVEVRGAVPLGLIYYHLPALTVILLSVVGSLLPVIPLLWILNNLTEHFRKIPVGDRFFSWLFTRTRSRSKLIEDLELVGLTLFIAIPFPGTGVWTGTIAAYLLGLRWLPTFACAAIGTLIATLVLAIGSGAFLRLF